MRCGKRSVRKRPEFCQAHGSGESIHSQEIDGQICSTLRRQVGHRFADDVRKFESVSAEAAGDENVRMMWMAIENKVRIGRVGLHAHTHR